MARDPVCGMDVDETSATETAEHKGQTFYFCSRGCRLDFEDDPEKYLTGEGGGHHEHSSHGGHNS